MTTRLFAERVLTVGIAAGLTVLMMGANRRAPDPIAGGNGGANARSGALDASFAGDGTLMTFIPPILEEPLYNTNVPYAVAIDGDGRILVAGDGTRLPPPTDHAFALERFNADGTLDTTFGTDGLATLPAPYDTEPTCLVVQPDGRILVGGGLNAFYALARFMPDGSLDPGFGQGGVVPRSGSLGPAIGIALLPDGRIVRGGGGNSLVLSRYESNGLPDDTFGTNGVVDTGLRPNGPTSMAQQADGRFVFVFWTGAGSSLVRLESDGSPDAGFASGGVVNLPIFVFFDAVVVQPDGKIFVGGASYRVLDQLYPPGQIELLDFAVARVNPDGSLDASFGGGGLVTTGFPGQSVRGGPLPGIQAVALDAQGRLVAAGTVVKHNGASDFALARYEPDGSLDPSFGKSGKTTADVDGHHADSVRAMAVQSDGRLVVVGDVTIDREGPLDSFAWGLARFLP